MRLSDWIERVDLAEEIQEVYVHSFLFKLGVRLVSIFLPLYLLNIGLNPLEVVLFFAAYYGVRVFASLPCSWIACRIGYKRASLAASPLLLLFYLVLRGLESGGTELYAVGLVGSLGFNLYWMGMNPEVATSSHSSSREKETGYFVSMSQLSSVISPFVGGLVLATFSFEVLFLLASGIMALSFTPFLLSSEHRDSANHELIDFVGKMDRADIFAFLFRGSLGSGRKVVWPLYLATIIGSLGIGGSGSLMALASAAVSIGVGKTVNSDNRGKVLAGGGIISALSYAGMSLVTGTGTALIVSALNGFATTSLTVPIYSRAQDHAEELDTAEYFAVREMLFGASKVAVLGMAAAAFHILPQKFAFATGFLAYGLGCLCTAFYGSRMC